jgi:hypothetical protein
MTGRFGPGITSLAMLASTLLLLGSGVCGAQTGLIDTPGSQRGTEAPAPRDSTKSKKGPKVFGYIQVHYRMAFATGDDSLVDNDDFRVQRARIGVEGDISPKVGYDVEIDPRAPEIGGVLRDAFLALHLVPRQEIRVGQQKTQFGYENRESSTRLFVVNRAEVSDNLSRGVTLRDIGVGLIGHINLSEGLRLEDAFTLVNGAGFNVQADNTPTKNGWGRLGLRWRNGDASRTFWLGASGGVGDEIDPGDDPLDPSDDFRIIFNRWGVDMELDHPLAFICGEYVSGHQIDKSTNETDEPVGWYALIAGKTPWRFGPILRVDDFDDDFHRYTFGGYYGLPSEKWRFLVNYEYRLRKDAVRGDDKLYFWTQVRF